jgi:hypothetical protein
MNDDGSDIRLLLQGAMIGREPEQRDLAGPAVSVVLYERKRMRVMTYTASALAVVAVAGAITVGVVASGDDKKSPAGATPTPTTSAKAAAKWGAWEKYQDVVDRLPALTNAVLPPGYSLAASRAAVTVPSFKLTGPTGANSVTMSATPTAQLRPEMLPGPNNCIGPNGRCSNHAVQGGTLYIQLKDFPANYGGASGFKPGTENTVLSVDDEYVFVPSSGTGYVYTFRIGATRAHAQYADKAPSDWIGEWPPKQDVGNEIEAFNAGGPLISQDQFVTMVNNPAMAAVGKLLDSSTPPSQTAIDEFKQVQADIEAKAKGLLPSGLTLAIGADGPIPVGSLKLSGPSGANAFQWRTQKQQPTWQHGWACARHTQTECKATDVPGGELAVTSPVGGGRQDDPTWYLPGSDGNSVFVDVKYEYLPDDPNGTVVTVELRAQVKDIPWAASRPASYPGGSWPPPARNGEAFNAGGALLTPEQFLTLAKSPDVVNTITTVNGYLRMPSAS